VTRFSAPTLIGAVADPGSFLSWDEPPDLDGFDPGYLAELKRAAAKSGTDEAVLTGRALVRGRPAALVVSEFGFLGGSVGRAAAARVAAAVRRATRERLPLIAAPASGGTRMQEGTPAFVQMVEITRAVLTHKAAGLPYVVYLRHPTTGGVFASWASLGHVALAEPGALIGFLGPAVYRALRGQPFPAGVQTAENLAAHGVVDAVVPAESLADVTARALTLLSGEPLPHRVGRRTPTADPPRPADPARPADPPRPAAPPAGGDAWTSVGLTRRPDRPGVRELLRDTAHDVLPLGGTQSGEAGDALLLALTSLAGTPCVLAGQDRRAQSRQRYLGPAELRAARRGMRIAEELRLPLVCVIDTPGADLSVAAEEGGLAGEIARCIADLVSLTTPTVSVLLGEGAGGGALALLPSRRVIAAGQAWLAPLPLEGASVILHGGTGFAQEMAYRQRISAAELLADGTVHAVVAEEPAAHEDPAAFGRAITAEILRQIDLQRS
jgi:acetyl-CoA carboxylase carboxyl transferase subunit beta